VLSLRGFLILSSLLGFLFVGQPAEGIKPLTPITLEFEVAGIPEVGVDLPVRLKVRSMMDIPFVTIHCLLPDGVDMISGEDRWEGEMRAGLLKEMPFTLNVKQPGRHLIRATAVLGFPGGAQMQKNAVLLIDLDEEKREKTRFETQGPSIRKGADGQSTGEFSLE
jgi:hypothetical protein